MLRPFLLVIDVNQGLRQEVLDFLDTRREVKNWSAFFPTGIVIIADSDVTTLSDLVHERFPTRHFLLTEMGAGTNNGWLPKTVWDFINAPKSTGRWP